jgi:uncharacterized protein (DUF983 family)
VIDPRNMAETRWPRTGGHDHRDHAPAIVVLLRGLRRRCPACGLGRLFHGLLHPHEHCSACGLAFASHVGDTWAWMYLSTAGLTGLIVIGMLLLRPFDLLLGRVTLAAIAVLAIPLTVPWRKGLAVALNHLLDRRSRVNTNATGGDPDADC